MHISSQASPSRPVPLAQAADGLAAKTSVKAGKNSSYSEYCPCPANLLRFWMRMAMPSSATATMRGARRCGVPASWRRRWARCSRLGIAGMCLMRRRGCTICGAGTIMHSGVGLLMRIMFSISVQHQIAIEFLTHLLIVAMELSSAQTQMENCGI